MYRKILVTVSLLIVATAGFAQRYRPFGGALNIYSTDVPFFLYINNVLYNNRASTDIRVPNLTSRRYDLRIVFADRQQRTLNGSGVQLVNRNGQYMNVVFSVSSRRGNRGIILESMNPVDRYNNGNYREDLPYTNRDGYRNEQGNDRYRQSEDRDDLPDNNREGYNKGWNNDRYRQSGDDKVYRDGVANQRGYAENEDNDQSDNGVMNKTNSNRLNDLLNQKENDQDRLAVAAQELKSMRLSVTEIVDLMELFIRDDNKLAFAKYAYPTCVDKQHYERVGDALSFSSTREKLVDFLKK
ncbi:MULTISPECIES: DUF4476 domain-containing protein [Sphingobacterium]|jgi:Domain of unknown function (DUF4476)|uniref:DUF4476 domain-containing protein n=1 Tax=Sphingobacterium multivorum TaxID=28454 RepID=A0A2X2JBH3_SPHMU|nr:MULTISPECIES: DUF4476 domain-containing protein [Sphingobacterium]HAE67684.1 DUF4476 domain-containing protein [Sphingobacterium sp.]MDF2853712.1 hypothetical protein [Sphingobacterium multivorum]OFV18017.1 hypothetical protein HMPREF3127_07470 [Sphingobacterium sp. HMSC13C05]OJZ06764.1 MAG: hypothetical protein BGP15_22390 [Sphingobacterium sp. 40-24]QQT47525.1 DUF4476 domain-containing protein [Sphingobacterium multivorum]